MGPEEAKILFQAQRKKFQNLFAMFYGRKDLWVGQKVVDRCLELNDHGQFVLH